jgi:hypothetical protein
VCRGGSGKCISESNERPRDQVRQPWNQERYAKNCQYGKRDRTPKLIGVHEPGASRGSAACKQGKSDGHSGQKRQTGSPEGLLGSRKCKWQDRQDARTENRQHPTEISSYEENQSLNLFDWQFGPRGSKVTLPPERHSCVSLPSMNQIVRSSSKKAPI